MFHKEFALLFIVASLVTFAPYTAEAQEQPLAIVSKGLVSYWTLDEIKAGKVEDIVGDNKGILQGNPKIVKGKYGNALAFDGATDLILLGTNNLPTGNSAVTISAWFFKEKRGATGMHVMAAFGVWDVGSTAQGVYTFVGQRRLNNVIEMSQGTNGKVRGPDTNLGEWHHVAAVYNGAKRNILYLDGLEVAAQDVPEANVQMGPIAGKQGEGAVIGANTRHQGLWDGLLDEIGIYNRALTLDEVRRNATAAQIFSVEPGGKLSLTWAKIKSSR